MFAQIRSQLLRIQCSYVSTHLASRMRIQELKAFQVGGGFFTGKYTASSEAAGQRFDAKGVQGQRYRERYVLSSVSVGRLIADRE